MKQKKPKVSDKPTQATPPTIVDEVRTFVSELRQFNRAQAAADTLVQRREQELAAARRELSKAQSAVLIANPDVEVDGIDSPASQAFVRASLEHEQARAAAAGVRRRIAERDVDILVIVEKLNVERATFNAAALARFTETIFEPARAAYARVLRQGAALTAALGSPAPGAGTLASIGDWKEDPEAVALHDQNCELLKLAQELAHFREESEHRVRARETEKHLLARSPFDPEATYRARKPFTVRGKNFATGDAVTTAQVDLGLLGKLHAAGFLITVATEEF